MQQIVAILAGMWVFLVAYTIVYQKGRPKVSKLAERLPDSAEAEIQDILNEGRTVSKTRYGQFYDKYMRKRIGNPRTLKKLSELYKFDLDAVDHTIAISRLQDEYTAEEILSLKVLGTVGLIVFLLIGVAQGLNLTWIAVGFGCYVITGFMPEKMLNRKIQQRKEQIENDLPEFLDLLKSVTGAGLTLPEAISKVISRSQGPLVDEFKQVSIDAAASGGHWRRAMELMALRNDIDSLSDVVSDILISYEKGTAGISEALGHQANMMRTIRNSNITAKANRMGVTLIVPMVIFYMLPIMVLMLGPIILSFITNF